MPRDIDDRKRQKALRKLRKAAQLAEQGLGPPLSDWEKQFLEEVEERIETFGSAFADPDKGSLDEPLSAMQSAKLKEIDKKARGKGSSGFGPKKGFSKKSSTPAKSWGRDIHEDIEPDEEVARPAPKPTGPSLVRPSSELKTPDDEATQTDRKTSVQTSSTRPAFRVIDGGKSD